MSMTLEQAIEHSERVYEKKLDERSYALEWHDNEEAEKCQKCADEHRQLAEWLKELAERREQPERKVGKWTEDNACEFCGFKPWYERDIHTLSYCPNCGADMRGEQYE